MVIMVIKSLGDFVENIFLFVFIKMFKYWIFFVTLCLIFSTDKHEKIEVAKSHPNFNYKKLILNDKVNLSKFLWFWFLNIFYQLLVILLLVLKSGDIHLNPGPELKNIHTLEAYEKKHGHTSTYLMFIYMNIRSINNKHDEFSQFLDKQTNNTFVVVTETWINEKQDIPENFLSNKHIFFNSLVQI